MQMGLRATFLPKTAAGAAGNSIHAHINLQRRSLNVMSGLEDGPGMSVEADAVRACAHACLA